MKLLHKNKQLSLYSVDDYFILKVPKKDVPGKSETIYNWINSKIGKFRKLSSIRSQRQADEEQNAEVLKNISVDYRFFNLVVIRK